MFELQINTNMPKNTDCILVALQLILVSICAIYCITISGDVREIKFYLYPKQGDSNYREEIKFEDDTSLGSTSFKPHALTVFLIHGYNEDSDTPNFKILKDAFVNSPFEANYIIVDWGELAGKPYLATNNLVLFPLALRNVRRVAKRLANFIDWLQLSGLIDLYHIHLIGHSLGTHVAGATGKAVQNAMGQVKLTRITGLDPAGPIIWPEDTWRNIKPSDAHFVDIIHTNYYEAETRSSMGHVNFIVNHDTIKEDCAIALNVITSCPDDWASTLFARSFTMPSEACQCSQLDLDEHNFALCLTECPNPVRVGLYTPHSARGIYSI